MFATDNEYDAIPYSVVDCDEHDALALKSAERSMVLLKNDGILPIDLHSIHSVAVIGPNATGESVLEGNYHGSSSRYVTYLQGIRNACREAHVRVNYAIGSHLTQSTIGYLAQENDRLSEAVNAAECSDVSIMFLGLNPSVEEECNDKQDLELPACQKKLIKAIIATGKPVVTVIAAGSALRVEDGNAILMAWYAGQAGGTAAANILFGKACPSGRLPITFYKSIDNLPEYTDYSMQGRTYRYFKGRALYPFGYGLPYTSFAYSCAEYDVEKNGVYVNIKNACQWQAEEVAEVYVKPIDYTPHNLNWSLVAFKRVALAPGEEKRIILPLRR